MFYVRITTIRMLMKTQKDIALAINNNSTCSIRRSADTDGATDDTRPERYSVDGAFAMYMLHNMT